MHCKFFANVGFRTADLWYPKCTTLPSAAQPRHSHRHFFAICKSNSSKFALDINETTAKEVKRANKKKSHWCAIQKYSKIAKVFSENGEEKKKSRSWVFFLLSFQTLTIWSFFSFRIVSFHAFQAFMLLWGRCKKNFFRIQRSYFQETNTLTHTRSHMHTFSGTNRLSSTHTHTHSHSPSHKRSHIHTTLTHTVLLLHTNDHTDTRTHPQTLLLLSYRYRHSLWHPLFFSKCSCSLSHLQTQAPTQQDLQSQTETKKR